MVLLGRNCRTTQCWEINLFNTLTESINAQAANYPFCTIEPNQGTITVPDKRLDKLEELVSTKSNPNDG